MKLWFSLILFAALPLQAQLYLNEMMFNPPGTDGPNEWIELRGMPGETIPNHIYLVGIEGDGSSKGDIQTIFDLSGLALGSNGYLVLLQQGSPWTNGVTGPNVLISNNTGWSGFPFFSADSGSDIENPSATFLLIQSAVAPSLSDDIDSTDTGVIDEPFASNWTILDGVAVLDDDVDTAYGPVVVFDEDGNGLAPDAITHIATTKTVNYVARILERNDHRPEDWVGAGITDAYRMERGETYSTYPMDEWVLRGLGHLNFPLLAEVRIQPIGSYRTGIFAEGATEINAFDRATQRLICVNAFDRTLDIIDASEPRNMQLFSQVDLSPYGNVANSVAAKNGIIAAAIEATPKQNPGVVAFFDADGTFLNQVTVGALPDMLTFTPDGRMVLVACEGEPNDDVTVDPVGSITIIDLSNGVAFLTQNEVTDLPMSQFDGAVLDPSIRIFTPGATVGQDLEPEYIAVAPSGDRAWAVCQENNAVVNIDLNNHTLQGIWGLGFKDHSLGENSLDPSDRDGGVQLQPWPVFGMYQPDGMAAYEVFGDELLVTANEGDARDYDGFSEEARVKDLTLDPVIFSDPSLQDDENLGRLKTTTTMGNTDLDPEYEEIYAYGARSFSLWRPNGVQVYDSQNQLERVTSLLDAAHFNSNEDDNDSFDSRSDDKGPEPEGLALGKVQGRTTLFLGLERIGGIMVYDIHNPHERVDFQQWFNHRFWSGDPEMDTAGDLAPEGLTFVEAATESWDNVPLLFVSNEVSGSTTAYRVDTFFTAVNIWGQDGWDILSLQRFINPKLPQR